MAAGMYAKMMDNFETFNMTSPNMTGPKLYIELQPRNPEDKNRVCR
jgi:hypothetical protein